MAIIELDGLMLGRRAHAIERYTLSLANHLVSEVEDLEVCVFTSRRRQQLEDRVAQFVVRGPADLAAQWLAKRRKGELSLYHLPYFPDYTAQIVPLALSHKSVLTVHDLAFFHFPYLPDTERERRLRRFELCLKWSSAIITDSAFMKNDIQEEFDLSEDSIEVVHPGIQKRFTKNLSKNHLAMIQRKHRLPERFLLTVGKDYPHKNLSVAVEAYRELRRGDAKRDIALVMAGSEVGGEETERIHRLVLEPDLAGKIHRVGHVSDEDLTALYQLAEVLVQPSSYEVFPMSVLEAMALGTPVVAIDQGAMREICSDAAILAREGTAEEMAKEVDRVLEDEQLRYSLVEAGRDRAKQFPWENAVSATYRVYERVLNEEGESEPSPEERERDWEEFLWLLLEEAASGSYKPRGESS